MSAPKPDVAVVIPCFGQHQFLGQAIESALVQSCPAAEIIVVDDGNDEDLSEFTRSYPTITLLRQANQGLAGARNSGLRASTAQRVIFLDADDRLCPNAVEAGLRCFDDNPGAAFVYGAYVEERGPARRLMFMPAAGRSDLLRFNCVAMIATAMFECAPLLQQGGFDETLGMCEDWDAFLRLSRSNSFAAHPNIVARYVLHEGNMSNNVAEMKSWMEVVRAKERDRGLEKDELKAWRDGGRAIDAIYLEPTLRGLSRRACRKALRLIGLGQYVPSGTINRRLASREQ